MTLFQNMKAQHAPSIFRIEGHSKTQMHVQNIFENDNNIQIIKVSLSGCFFICCKTRKSSCQAFLNR